MVEKSPVRSASSLAEAPLKSDTLEPVRAPALDRAHVEALITKEYAGLRLLIFRRARDLNVAADLLNDAICTTWEKWLAGQIAHPEQIAGYVFQVAMNLLRNHRRAMAERPDKRAEVKALDELPMDESPEARGVEDRLAHRVKRLLQGMSSQRDPTHPRAVLPERRRPRDHLSRHEAHARAVRARYRSCRRAAAATDGSARLRRARTVLPARGDVSEKGNGMSVTKLFNDDDPTIANRYLAGQLTQTEQATFEAELESNATTLQELEATARLKVGLERLRETGQLDDMLRPTSTTRQVLVGLAATIAVAVIAASFLIGYFREPTTAPMLAATSAAFVDMQGSVLPVGGTYAVFRKRVDDYDVTISLPSDRKVIALRAFPSPGAAQRYRVSLARMRDDGSVEPSESVAALNPADDGFVTVFVDSALLSPGRDPMSVSAADGPEIPRMPNPS